MSLQASSLISPASITEGISTRTILDIIKDFNTEELIEYLGRKDLKLKESHFKILRKEEIASSDFLNTTKEEFQSYDMKANPAKRLNLVQLESAFQTNKKKRTLDQAFGNDYFDYIYGIVTTGMEWHFIIYTPDGIIFTSDSEYQINLTKSMIKNNPELLLSNVKRVISIIVGLLKDRVSVDSSLTSKRARIKKFIKKLYVSRVKT
ncbi:hypothetical protein C1646_782603 [Rhizophagus diaphanus]|nr:hypothetical protein C1646_782603 [Rhizophagus diaphanus] [Rhizophagus sp. MUCL 43196]